MRCWMAGSPERHNCPQHNECYGKTEKHFSQYCKNFNTCDALKMLDTLREGYKRLAKMYAGGEVEGFCLQILDHSKEYEDRAIIQQQVQPDKARECSHPDGYFGCASYYADSDLCAFSGPCRLT